MLLDARGSDFDRASLFLAVHVHMQEPSDEVRLAGCESDSHPPDFFGFDTERFRVHFQTCSFRWVDLQVDLTRHPALVFELDLLVLGGLDGHEPEVDERLELHIWSRSEGVQEELELLVMTLSLDLNNVVEVSLLVCLERNVHLDGKTGCEWSLHVVLDLELGSLRAGELEPSHSLADVPYGDSHLVVLVGLDICRRKCGSKWVLKFE